MIYTVSSSYVAAVDARINKLRKHYSVDVIGFSVSGRYIYAMLDITEMDVWDPDLGEEPGEFPTTPEDLNALILS